MELPVHSLRAQLEAAYQALEILNADRQRWRHEADAAATDLKEVQARISAAAAAMEQAEQKVASDVRRISSERDAARDESRRLKAAYEVLVESFTEFFVRAEVAQTNMELGRQVSAEQVEQFRQRLASSQVESEALLTQLRKVHASSSWRITRPLRGAMRALRWLRGVARWTARAMKRLVFAGLRAAWWLPFRATAALLRRVSRTTAAPRRAAIRAANAGRAAAWRIACRAGNATLDALTYLAAWWRAHIGRPRTMWGVTPILTLPLLARCDRLLGLRSDSLVFTVYYINKNFDINLKKLCDYIYTKRPHWALRMHKTVLRLALIRYDVFHLFCDRGLLLPTRRMEINESEMLAMRRYGRRLYTYAYGADVRTRRATLALGRYNICAECPEPMKFCTCGDEEGQRNVASIRVSATAMIAMGDMLAYVPEAQNFHYWPIDTKSLSYVGVDWQRDRPLRVGHAPNHPHFKGTQYLLAAIERLQSEGRAIELVRVQGVPNSDVIALFSSCDLVADQFIAGFHGYTALEAMALGKPVLCYLRSPEMTIDPVNCPMINAWPDTVYDALKDCLDGRHDLAALGRRSRAYLEHYYSLEAVALRLGELYLATARFGTRTDRRISRRMTELERLLPPLIAAPPPVPWEEAAQIAGDGLRVALSKVG